MDMHAVIEARDGHEREMARLRHALWPDTDVGAHLQEYEDLVASNPDVAVFVLARAAGGLCGFVEASLHASAIGCTSSPVGYVEGWFVEAHLRRRGWGACSVVARLDRRARSRCTAGTRCPRPAH